MRFALFFLAEYAGMITTSAVCVALFFGGWHVPWLDRVWPNVFGDPASANPDVTAYILVNLLRAGMFFFKTIVIIFVFMWVRWSLPRFRFDQVMQLAWRALIPISLALFMVTAIVVFLWRDHERAFMRVSGSMALALLAASIVMSILTMFISLILPAAPDTNRKIPIRGSRFMKKKAPAASAGTAAVPQLATGN
jgi:NADH-quinone oxidoreductase subunit H